MAFTLIGDLFGSITAALVSSNHLDELAMSSAVHFLCQISTVIRSRGFSASPPTEHALMLIYTFSSVQYGGLVSNGPTVPWNTITCLFTDLQRKKKEKKKNKKGGKNA